jgi:ATP-binding cassette subfamily F protein 2
VWTGNYDQYIKTKKEHEVNQMKMYRKEQDDIKHLKKFIASCGTYGNLVKQAKSKQKILDKMYAKGLTEKVQDPLNYSYKFKDCERLPPPLIAFDNVSFSYDGKMENALYQNVDVGCDQDSRVAIVGPNGAGKSTVLDAIWFVLFNKPYRKHMASNTVDLPAPFAPTMSVVPSASNVTSVH